MCPVTHAERERCRPGFWRGDHPCGENHQSWLAPRTCFWARRARVRRLLGLIATRQVLECAVSHGKHSFSFDQRSAHMHALALCASINAKALVHCRWVWSSSHPPCRQLSHAGWLNKRGRVNKAYRRRWFELRGSVLRYSATHSGAVRGEVDVGGSNVTPTAASGRSDQQSTCTALSSPHSTDSMVTASGRVALTWCSLRVWPRPWHECRSGRRLRDVRGNTIPHHHAAGMLSQRLPLIFSSHRLGVKKKRT